MKKTNLIRPDWNLQDSPDKYIDKVNKAKFRVLSVKEVEDNRCKTIKYLL